MMKEFINTWCNLHIRSQSMDVLKLQQVKHFECLKMCHVNFVNPCLLLASTQFILTVTSTEISRLP